MAPTTTTRSLVVDYIRYRLNEAGICGSKMKYIRDMFIDVPVGDSIAMDEIKFVGRQMETHLYHSAFLDMTAQQFEILSENAKGEYKKLLGQLFADNQINWGRLVLVIVYTGRLAVRAMKRERPGQVRNLVEWCETFFRDNYLDQWIEANGGWEKLKGVYATDWQRKEVTNELRSLSAGFLTVMAIIATGYYILRRNV